MRRRTPRRALKPSMFHGVPDIDQQSSDPAVSASSPLVPAQHLGVPYERSAEWFRRFGELADQIVADLAPASVLDVGCTHGLLVEALLDRGVEAHGIDPSQPSIAKVGGVAKERCSVASATAAIEGSFDLVVALEMLESLDQSEGAVALANLAAVTDRILLAPAPFDTTEVSLLAAQPPMYWAQVLAELGFYRDLSHDASGSNRWTALYVRSDATTAALVGDYERSEWQARHEAAELGRQLALVQSEGTHAHELVLQERLATMAARAVAAEQAVRLARDAAAAAEAELGVQSARARDLENRLVASEAHISAWSDLSIADERQAGLEAIQQLEEVHASMTWRVMWALLAPYRALRGRS